MSAPYADDDAESRQAEAWSALIEADPYLGYRMLTVRYMMEDRALTQVDVSRMLLCTKAQVSRVLTPNYIRYSGRKPQAGKDLRPETVHLWLDRIENVITDVPFTQEGDDWYDDAREDRINQLNNGW